MKYIVNCWAHVTYPVEIEANSFEEAEELVEGGAGEYSVNRDGFKYGDCGISYITDENGKMYFCE